MKKPLVVALLLSVALPAHSLERRLIGREDINWGTGTFQDSIGTTFHQIDNTAAVGMIIGDGTNVISTGTKGYITVPFACTIVSVTLLADVSGSIVVDIWKDTYANYPPTVEDSITASAHPTISSATKSTDTTLIGWTKAISAGDVLAFNVEYATTIKQLSIILKVQR